MRWVMYNILFNPQNYSKSEMYFIPIVQIRIEGREAQMYFFLTLQLVLYIIVKGDEKL